MLPSPQSERATIISLEFIRKTVRRKRWRTDRPWSSHARRIILERPNGRLRSILNLDLSQYGLQVELDRRLGDPAGACDDLIGVTGR
jgi:hypothetical protein